MRIRNHRFLIKLFNSSIRIHFQNAKTRHIIFVLVCAYNCHIRTFGNVIFQYFIIIQLINTITGCNDHVRLMAVFQKRQILIDCIRSSSVPPAVIRGDGRCEYIKTTLFSSEIPPLGRHQMLVQRSCIILCQNCHFLNMRIRHIT